MLRVDAEQRINEFHAECRVENEQRIKECHAETEQRIKECRVEYGAAAGQRIKEYLEEAEQRINEFRTDPVITLCGHLFCWPCLYKWLHHRSHPQECPVCKGVVGEEKLVPLYGKGRSVTDPRTEIPPRPSDIHTLFASLEQMRLSREATEQRFKEYIDQCIEEFCVAQEQRIALLQVAQERRFQQLECRADADYRIKKFRAEAEQRIKECRAEVDQRIRECRAEYRADAEQRIKMLRADAEQRINEFRAECRVETEQRIKECRAETEQRIKECRVEYGAAAGQRIKECLEEAEQRINEFRTDPVITLCGHLFCWPCLYKWLHHRSHPQECPVCKGVVGEEKLVPLYGKGRSVTDPRTEIPPRPSDIHTLFASLEQMRLSREATEQRFKEYIDQCIEEFCVAQEQRIALLQVAQERRFQQLECRIKECRADADYRIKKFRAEAEQRIKECRAEADQRIRECRADYRADAEQRIKKLRADAEQRINEFRTECRVETEQRIKDCRAKTEHRIKECRVEYGAAAGQRIKECREEAEQRINEFRADPVITLCGHLFCWPCLYKWLHHRSHPQECSVCKGVVGEEKLVPLYGKGRSVTDPRTEIPPRPSDIHTLFASLEQMRLSREATEQCFKEYIDQCIGEFCVAQEQRIALLQVAQERQADQRIRECRAEYRADAEQRIKKLHADAEQRINEFRAECRVETKQRIEECRAETEQRIMECRVEYGAAAGQRIKECREEAEQRINEFRTDPVITLCGHLFCWPCLYKWLHHRSHPQECPVCKGVVGEEKLVPLYGKGRSVTDPRTEIPPRPSDIHTLFASLEQMHLSREATEQRFKEYIDQCIEEFCVAQEQRIALLQVAQERHFQQLECRIKECRADADYRIKKFRAEAEQRIKECRAEADQRIRECRAEYRADAEQRIKKLRADAEQRINEFCTECRVETEQRIKECRAETEQRLKECRVEYGAAAGQRIKECREEAEQCINEFRADPVITLCGHLFCWPCLYKWLHHRSHPQECSVCKGVVGEEKLVPLYGKERLVTDPRTEIPPRPSDIHTLFASLEQMRLSREATEQCFKEYIDQCIGDFCVAQEQRIALLQVAQERQADQRIRECRAEYRADAEQRIKKLHADAEQRINEFRAECRVETKQHIKECRAETEQRIMECRVEYGAAAGQRIKECREKGRAAYQRVSHGLGGTMRSAIAPNPSCSSGNRFNDDACDFECNEIPPRPSDIHTLFASLEQMRLSREATEQRFKEYIDQCIEEFCVAREQRIALLQEAQERRFQQLECRIKECRADADYRIKKFRAEAEQRIKECRAEVDQRIRECRTEYRADAEQRIKMLRADAEQRINEFCAECRVETEQRIKECRAETEQRIKECRVEYGAAAGQRIKECLEEAEQRINEFRTDPVITLCGHLFCWPCLYKWLHHRSHPQECPVCKGVVGEEKLVPFYGKGRSVTDPRTEIPPRPFDIHTLFASLEQMRLSREATEQCFKEYIDQCIGEFCVAQKQRIALLQAEQRIKECRAEADQRIRECRAEYRAAAEQRIKKLRADAEQRINEFYAECRVETEQRIKECRAETEQRIKECRVEYGAAAGQRIKECREEAEQCINEFRDPVITLCGHLFCWPCLYKWLHHRSHPQECPVCKGVIGEEKLVPLYGKGRSVTDSRTEIPPRPSDIHTLFACLEQMCLSRKATEQRFKEYIDQCIEEFCVAQEQRIALLQAEQRIKECRAEADQRIRECRAEYRADAEQRIKKLRADAEQRTNEFRAECRVETEQHIKECRAETEQRIKECRVEYGAAAGQRIKECREEAEQCINEFRAWLHHRSHPQECPVCKGVVGEEKLVPFYGKGRSVTDPRTEIPPRPFDIHTLFASLEQMRLSREATEQCFKEYIDQCIGELCVAQKQRIALLQAEQRIKECRAEADQRIRECRAEYRAAAEQRIKKLRADAEQRINEFYAECRVETEQRIKECRAETEQRLKECRVEYGAAAGQRIKECREEAEQCINEFRWLHHRSHPQECPVCKGVIGEEKLVTLYGKGRSVTDSRTEIPPRPSDIHTLFACLEQMCLSREATEQHFKEYIDQCIEEFCVAQEQQADYRIKEFLTEAEQRIKECRAEADQRIRECRAEYRADAEQRIKKLRADAEQRTNEFRAECRVETEQHIKECRAETEQRIKECRVEYGAAAGQRIKECREEAEQCINEFRADPVITLCGHLFCWPCLYKWLHHRSHPQECPICKGVVGEEKLVPLYGKGRSVTDPRTEIPPRPSDIHTLFASLEQMRLSREATEQRFKEYIDQCIEEFCVAQEQRIALLQAEQRIKECHAEADQRIRECRAEYRADAEQCIKKLRADAEQRINEFCVECRVETEQRIKECRAETEQRLKECRVEYGAAAGQRIKECREEAEQCINEFQAVWEEP
ncbi:hypothetical protein KIW84_024698 [Lathyrus oleraceus]|uniref:E3 ubiquitin-protein ligase RMA n=1 Tax=Pisum sativum TaxID=3888 RepID=A0A9D4YM81_PEA|nr:hypothetical protein KIW84_024698 [Pisum sativum]